MLPEASMGPTGKESSLRSFTSSVVKRKVCLVGEEEVGKTSLIRRFVTGEFDEAYVRTLGAVVSKKSLSLDTTEGRVRVDMLVYDITGKRTFLELFRDAYLKGVAGVLAVFDMTRRRTLVDLAPWIDGVLREAGSIPVLALGNKSDLQDRIEVQAEDIDSVLGPRKVGVVRTSAKTGVRVEDAFLRLARDMLLASHR